ncbi:hypothetical protein B0H14DRAFT_3508260 [Mycena olivaceomarginata]|nr:hypothetical protein B0H14DRAFT_3508260 [Mycena olivaceomarginata]
MQPISAAATGFPHPRIALREAIATVDRLLAAAESLKRDAEELQEQLPHILDHFNEDAAADNIWVRTVPRTPEQVEREHEAAPHGSHSWWVVFVGREPGLYTTVEAVDANVRNCPGQQIRQKKSKREAIAYYCEMWDTQKVEKWVELKND